MMIFEKNEDDLIYLKGLMDLIEPNLYIDLRAFFDIVILYQLIFVEADFFQKEFRFIDHQTFFKRIKNLSSFLNNIKLQSRGGLHEVMIFARIYDKKTLLNDYFKSFQKRLEKGGGNHFLGILLESDTHVIAIMYDPLNKGWLLIDPNNLDCSCKKINIDFLVNNIFSIFGSLDKEICLKSTILFSFDAKDIADNVVYNWKNTIEF